ncbi:MAG: cobalamin B12-binding domain-containing protein [Candidatus Rokubacteria bacterium]|nr:cobalamin B12-binding domain-containing protein [Candidatus Rokubacteria bacterium]MBI2493125.1 cobalamin B12-binding domain-containing protein [Candidatus Rokubacteria bacterium]
MRPLRVLIGTLGLDQHEVGAVAVARQLRDAGIEVVYLGRFNLPPAIVKTAADEAVDVIGLSCHSWEYLYYVDELLGLLREHGLQIPVVLGGSVITAADARALEARGVAATFGPTSAMNEIPEAIRRLVASR